MPVLHRRLQVTLAIAFLLLALAGLFVGPLRTLHAQQGFAEHLLIYFADTFQDTGYTVTHWRYGGHKWTTANEGSNKVMRGEMVPGEVDCAAICAAKGRTFLAEDFDISVRLKIAAGPEGVETGIGWCAQQVTPPYNDCYFACLTQHYLRLAYNVGHHTTWLGSTATEVERDRWYTLRVVSTEGRLQVWLDGDLRLEAADPGIYSAGVVGIYTKNPACFDDFRLSARPERAGTMVGSAFNWPMFQSIDPQTVSLGIYTIEADGTGGRFLRSEPNCQDEYASYSPDGSSITFRRTYFHTPSETDVAGMYVMDLYGGQLTNLSVVSNPNPDTDRSATAAWSPDGQWILFNSYRDGNYEIYKMRSDGTGAVNLTNDPGSDRYGCWSPDGRQIAFVSSRSGWSEIWAIDADGGNPHQITCLPELATKRYPDWSPDGSTIVFEGGPESSEGSEIYSVRVDGTDLQQLTSFPSDGKSYPRWSPDGSKIAFNASWSGVFFGQTLPYVMDANGGNCYRMVPDYVYVPEFDRLVPQLMGEFSWHPSQPQEPRQVAIPSVVGTPGMAVAVPLYLSPVRGVAALQFDLRYDPALLGGGSLTLGELVSDLPGWQVAVQFSAGRAQGMIYNDLGTPVYGYRTAPIAYLHLQVAPGAPEGSGCALDFASVLLADGLGEPLPVDSVWDGWFTTALLDHFAFDPIASPQGADLTNPLPIAVRVRAISQLGEVCSQYQGTVALSDLLVGDLGTVSLVNGEWSGQVALQSASGRAGDVLSAVDASMGVSGSSNSFDVIVKGSVNGDQAINVLDVMKTVNIILGNLQPAPWQAWAADVNTDGDINVLDILVIINKAFTTAPAPRPATAPRAQPVRLHLTPGPGEALRVWSDNAAGVSGFQFDLVGPAMLGSPRVTAGSLLAGRDWSIFAQPMGDRMRIVAFSNTSTPLPAGKGDLLTVSAGGRGMPRLANVVLGDAAGRRVSQ